MSNKMWEALVEHAKTCVLSGKYYIYYSDGTGTVGAIFNNIYAFCGLISDEQFYSSEGLDDNQKVSIYIRNCIEGSLVHVAPACAGSGEGSDHFGSYVRSLYLHFCKRLFPRRTHDLMATRQQLYCCVRTPLLISEIAYFDKKKYGILVFQD
jgi:hypothetical protein